MFGRLPESRVSVSNHGGNARHGRPAAAGAANAPVDACEVSCPAGAFLPLFPLADVTAGNWTLAAATVFLVAVGVVINIIATFRRHPPLDRTLSDYAKATDLHRHREQWRQDLNGLREESRAMDVRIEQRVEAIGQQIGQQYESLQRADETRSSNLHRRLDTMASKIDNVSGQVQQLPCNKPGVGCPT